MFTYTLYIQLYYFQFKQILNNNILHLETTEVNYK